MAHVVNEGTQPAHTPGPWVVGETRHEYDAVIRNADYDPVCSVYLAGYMPRAAKANARLIAAAPDLLTVANWALSRLVSVSDVSDEQPEAMQLQRALRAAIAKAEGRDA